MCVVGLSTAHHLAAHHFTAHARVSAVKVDHPTTRLFGEVKGSSSSTFREQGSAAPNFHTWSRTVCMENE
ncbi:hypothetical protein HEP87_52615 [Streptomyces sp. S1D4-11]